MRHILVANIHFAPFSYGGATIVAEEVAQALIRAGGYRVSAISLCQREDLAPYMVIKSEVGGVENYLINVPHNRNYGEMYNNPEVTTRIAELTQALMPDLVHVHCIQEMGTGVLAVAAAQNIPVVLSVHDFWWLCERQFMIRVDGSYCGQSPVQIKACKGCADNYWAAKMRFDHLQEMGRLADVVTYPSTFAKDLSEASGFATGRGVVWENGVRLPDPAFFDRQTARRLKQDKLNFGYIGGPSAIKGWPQIREAFRGLDRDDFRVLVVDGSLDGSWWAKRNLKPLPGEWVIHPRFDQESMDAFYAQIDVLLFMSQWKETFGLAIREALARGIQVIQTDSGGTVEHGAVAQDQLIPIGAGTEQLRRQLTQAIELGATKHAPVPVTSFADQARAFHDLVEEVLNKSRRAA